MRFLSVKNLSKYQHYSKRNPPWVKLHREFITDYHLRNFSVQTRLFFSCCWLLASESDNKIPYDLRFLSERVGFKVTQHTLDPLLSASLITSVSDSDSVSVSPLSLTENSVSLAPCKQTASRKSMMVPLEFEQFWTAYPRKIGKKAALHAWQKATDKPGVDVIMQAIESAKKTDQWTKDNGQFIPHPATWLNQGRWADSVTVLSNGHLNQTKIPPFPGPEDPIGRNSWRQAYGDPTAPRQRA